MTVSYPRSRDDHGDGPRPMRFAGRRASSATPLLPPRPPPPPATLPPGFTPAFLGREGPLGPGIARSGLGGGGPWTRSPPPPRGEGAALRLASTIEGRLDLDTPSPAACDAINAALTAWRRAGCPPSSDFKAPPASILRTSAAFSAPTPAGPRRSVRFHIPAPRLRAEPSFPSALSHGKSHHRSLPSPVTGGSRSAAAPEEEGWTKVLSRHAKRTARSTAPSTSIQRSPTRIHHRGSYDLNSCKSRHSPAKFKQAHYSKLRRCHRCQAGDHLRIDCRDPLRCATCSRWGHAARDCRPPSSSSPPAPHTATTRPRVRPPSLAATPRTATTRHQVHPAARRSYSRRPTVGSHGLSSSRRDDRDRECSPRRRSPSRGHGGRRHQLTTAPPPTSLPAPRLPSLIIGTLRIFAPVPASVPAPPTVDEIAAQLQKLMSAGLSSARAAMPSFLGVAPPAPSLRSPATPPLSPFGHTCRDWVQRLRESPPDCTLSSSLLASPAFGMAAASGTPIDDTTAAAIEDCPSRSAWGLIGINTATSEVGRRQNQIEHDSGRKVPVSWDEEEGHDAATRAVRANERCYKVSVDGALSEENERTGLGLLPLQREDNDRDETELEVHMHLSPAATGEVRHEVVDEPPLLIGHDPLLSPGASLTMELLSPDDALCDGGFSSDDDEDDGEMQQLLPCLTELDQQVLLLDVEEVAHEDGLGNDNDFTRNEFQSVADGIDVDVEAATLLLAANTDNDADDDAAADAGGTAPSSGTVIRCVADLFRRPAVPLLPTPTPPMPCAPAALPAPDRRSSRLATKPQLPAVDKAQYVLHKKMGLDFGDMPLVKATKEFANICKSRPFSASEIDGLNTLFRLKLPSMTALDDALIGLAGPGGCDFPPPTALDVSV